MNTGICIGLKLQIASKHRDFAKKAAIRYQACDSNKHLQSLEVCSLCSRIKSTLMVKYISANIYFERFKIQHPLFKIGDLAWRIPSFFQPHAKCGDEDDDNHLPQPGEGASRCFLTFLEPWKTRISPQSFFQCIQCCAISNTSGCYSSESSKSRHLTPYKIWLSLMTTSQAYQDSSK